MTHTTEIVAWERVNNGQHRIWIRCCGNKDTDHSHLMNTMAPDDNGEMKPVDKQKRDENIAAMKELTAQHHEEMLKTADEFLDKAGEVTEHP